MAIPTVSVLRRSDARDQRRTVAAYREAPGWALPGRNVVGDSAETFAFHTFVLPRVERGVFEMGETPQNDMEQTLHAIDQGRSNVVMELGLSNLILGAHALEQDPGDIGWVSHRSVLASAYYIIADPDDWVGVAGHIVDDTSRMVVPWEDFSGPAFTVTYEGSRGLDDESPESVGQGSFAFGTWPAEMRATSEDGYLKIVGSVGRGRHAHAHAKGWWLERGTSGAEWLARRLARENDVETHIAVGEILASFGRDAIEKLLGILDDETEELQAETLLRAVARADVACGRARLLKRIVRRYMRDMSADVRIAACALAARLDDSVSHRLLNELLGREHDPDVVEVARDVLDIEESQ